MPSFHRHQSAPNGQPHVTSAHSGHDACATSEPLRFRTGENLQASQSLDIIRAQLHRLASNELKGYPLDFEAIFHEARSIWNDAKVDYLRPMTTQTGRSPIAIANELSAQLLEPFGEKLSFQKLIFNDSVRLVCQHYRIDPSSWKREPILDGRAEVWTATLHDGEGLSRFYHDQCCIFRHGNVLLRRLPASSDRTLTVTTHEELELLSELHGSVDRGVAGISGRLTETIDSQPECYRQDVLWRVMDAMIRLQTEGLIFEALVTKQVRNQHVDGEVPAILRGYQRPTHVARLHEFLKEDYLRYGAHLGATVTVMNDLLGERKHELAAAAALRFIVLTIFDAQGDGDIPTVGNKLLPVLTSMLCPKPKPFHSLFWGERTALDRLWGRVRGLSVQDAAVALSKILSYIYDRQYLQDAERSALVQAQ